MHIYKLVTAVVNIIGLRFLFKTEIKKLLLQHHHHRQASSRTKPDEIRDAPGNKLKFLCMFSRFYFGLRNVFPVIWLQMRCSC